MAGVEYATGEIADKTFAVTGARVYGHEIRLGDLYWGNRILGIEFYTGFAGCPARYYITTTRSTTIANATGIYRTKYDPFEYQDHPGYQHGPMWDDVEENS